MTFNTTLKMHVMSTYVLWHISDSETKTRLVTHGLVCNVPVNVKEKNVELLSCWSAVTDYYAAASQLDNGFVWIQDKYL